MYKKAYLLVVAVLLSACSSGSNIKWVNSDGVEVSKSEVSVIKDSCRYDAAIKEAAWLVRLRTVTEESLQKILDITSKASNCMKENGLSVKKSGT